MHKPIVKLHYGPYEKHGVIRHKTQRLRSVVECLTNLGYAVDLVPSPHLERVTVEMKGIPIFRCSILSFSFNMSCAEDPVVKKLISAVNEAKERLCSKYNIPHFDPISEGQRVVTEMKNAKPPKNVFAHHVKLWY